MAKGKKTRPTALLMAAVICFGVAAISFGGLILRSDQVGRVVFGAAWGTLGLVWFGKYLMGTSVAGRQGTEDGPTDDAK